MCGIAGRLGREPVSNGAISTARNLLHHRGPDGFRHLSEKFGQNELTFLFSRLAVIDLDSRSMQPVEFGETCLIFNGEIYNFREVRTRLEAVGHRFTTTGDAEVLIHALCEWGIDALHELEGMWAFAWLDRRTNAVWLARDRFGEKPLFWCHTDEEVVFASEIATLRSLSSKTPAVNYGQIYRYLVNGYKSLNKSIDSFYDGIYRVEPGSWIRIDADLSVERGRYWNLKFNPQQKMKFADAVAETRWRLEAAVRRTLQADVPVAFSLSAGVDSNALAFTAKSLGHAQINAFTIQTRDVRYDESVRVKAIVNESGFNHEFIRIEKERGLDRLREQVAQRSSPVATISYFLQSRLYEVMAERGIKVSLSGTAADEIFTGYFDHHLFYFAAIQDERVLLQDSIRNWSTHIQPHVRNPFLSNPRLFIDNPEFREHIYLESEAFSKLMATQWSEKFTERQFCDDVLRNRMMNELFHEATPVILHEDDINAMAASVENRSPYLDRQLVEFAFTIPTALLIRDGYAKAILREAVRDLVPKSIAFEHRKVGFNATLTDVFDFESEDLREVILSDSELFSIVSRNAVENLLNQKQMQNSTSKFLFNVLNVKLLLEQQST